MRQARCVYRFLGEECVRVLRSRPFFFSFHRQVVSDITDNNFLKREKNFCILFKVPFLYMPFLIYLCSTSGTATVNTGSKHQTSSCWVTSHHSMFNNCNFSLFGRLTWLQVDKRWAVTLSYVLSIKLPAAAWSSYCQDIVLNIAYQIYCLWKF